MKLVIATHSGVIAVNRKVFVLLAEKTGWEITLIVPETWKGDLIRTLVYRPEPEEKNLKVLALKPVFSGKGSFFFYKTLLPKNLSADLFFLFEEPWSINAFQYYRHFRGSKRVFFTNQNIFKHLPPPFNFIQKYVLKNSVAAFPVSDEAAEVLRRKNYTGPIEKLPYSYDETLFHRSHPNEKNSTRLKYNLDSGATLFGYVGRLTEEKGIEDFLAAIELSLARTGDSRPKSEFLIIGNGPLRAKIEKMLVRFPPGRVHLFEALPHDEIGSLIRALDVLVLPSRTTRGWKEQFGRILIEAWASGVAVIGSDSGEIPNLIRLTKGGLVFKEKSIADFSQKIQNLADDLSLLGKMKENGYQYVSEKLTHSAVADYLAEKLGELTRSPEHPRD